MLNSNSPELDITSKMIGPRVLFRARELMESEKLTLKEALARALAEIRRG